MSIQIDLNSIGDLIAAEGTEADKRAWARVKAEMDAARREASHLRDCLLRTEEKLAEYAAPFGD